MKYPYKVTYRFNDTWHCQESSSPFDRFSTYEQAQKYAEQQLREKFPHVVAEIIKHEDKEIPGQYYGRVKFGYHTWNIIYDPSEIN